MHIISFAKSFNQLVDSCMQIYMILPSIDSIIYIYKIYGLQVTITSINPRMHWGLRLVQARAVSGSFFVNMANGITERVMEVNRSMGATFKAGMLWSDMFDSFGGYATILVKMPLWKVHYVT